MARLDQDPGLQAGAAQDAAGNTIGGRPFAIALPRMSFELTSFEYDAERKVSPTRRVRKTTADVQGGNRRFVYAGTPYNMGFSLYIMAKYNEDAVKLLEQVLPFFNPDYTSTVRMIPELEPLDIPLILNNVSSEDIYEGGFETRRAIVYQLDFTMKGWFFGQKKIRKLLNSWICVWQLIHQLIQSLKNSKQYSRVLTQTVHQQQMQVYQLTIV